ncbi:Mss4-like protein [Phaeosphaeriaceae sp. PMI808]|nr:Mss4-like protein [Phaeosphaeriaceae sp. PMI808]
MRFPSFSALLRTFHTVTNTTRAFLQSAPTLNSSRTIHATAQPAALYRSMPTIPFLGALFGSSSKMPDNTNYPVQKTDGEWQAQLSPEQFRILRKKGTEMPGSGTYDKHYPTAGVYTCTACETPLYKANHKFDSGCGWPAFWDAVPGAVGQRPDPGLGMMRTEIVCNNCGGHLGHIFKGEKFGNPKDERHCVNSVSINFSAKEEEGEESK